MAEVFTISGANDPYDVELLGDAGTDAACAQEVKVPLIVGAVGQFASVPVGLFGLYRTIKPNAEGSRAGGIVGLVAAAGLFFVSRGLLASAVRRFAVCRGPGPQPAPPAG